MQKYMHALQWFRTYMLIYKVGSGVLSGKMLLVRIVENNKMYAYSRVG